MFMVNKIIILSIKIYELVFIFMQQEKLSKRLLVLERI